MMEILDEARHFADVSQPQRSEDLEMCLKRVVFKMELLGRVYKVRLYISLSAAFGTASCAWNSPGRAPRQTAPRAGGSSCTPR